MLYRKKIIQLVLLCTTLSVSSCLSTFAASAARSHRSKPLPENYLKDIESQIPEGSLSEGEFKTYRTVVSYLPILLDYFTMTCISVGLLFEKFDTDTDETTYKNPQLFIGSNKGGTQANFTAHEKSPLNAKTKVYNTLNRVSKALTKLSEVHKKDLPVVYEDAIANVRTKVGKLRTPIKEDVEEKRTLLTLHDAIKLSKDAHTATEKLLGASHFIQDAELAKSMNIGLEDEVKIVDFNIKSEEQRTTITSFKEILDTGRIHAERKVTFMMANEAIESLASSKELKIFPHLGISLLPCPSCYNALSSLVKRCSGYPLGSHEILCPTVEPKTNTRSTDGKIPELQVSDSTTLSFTEKIQGIGLIFLSRQITGSDRKTEAEADEPEADENQRKYLSDLDSAIEVERAELEKLAPKRTVNLSQADKEKSELKQIEDKVEEAMKRFLKQKAENPRMLMPDAEQREKFKDKFVREFKRTQKSSTLSKIRDLSLGENKRATAASVEIDLTEKEAVAEAGKSGCTCGTCR